MTFSPARRSASSPVSPFFSIRRAARDSPDYGLLFATSTEDIMSKMDRRDFMKISAGLAAGAAGGVPMLAQAQGAGPAMTWKPEKGANLRVVLCERCVEGDEDVWMQNTKKFSAQTGVEVRVDNESWEDVRPKAAVAANVGSGPDIILSTFDDANLYPEKLLDVTDVADYLGKKYGGWFPAVHQYLRPDGKKWLGLGLGA